MQPKDTNRQINIIFRQRTWLPLWRLGKSIRLTMIDNSLGNSWCNVIFRKTGLILPVKIFVLKHVITWTIKLLNSMNTWSKFKLLQKWHFYLLRLGFNMPLKCRLFSIGQAFENSSNEIRTNDLFGCHAMEKNMSLR